MTILRVEKGVMSPTVSLLEKLAEGLGISVRDFFPTEKRAKRRER